MWKQNILILLQFLQLANVFCDGAYECGEHGRFEYCIDEIPGCVIGCYCHPGYYFDTDTKICEPNSKLIEHHRRHYAAEPTRVQSHIITPDQNSAATTSKIDGTVNEITKDAEDLGDWLYNQFFKTIENQVINSTNAENIQTRRSASVKSMKKPKRRRKLKKRGKSRNKEKKDNMKQKLLRITENDSVFDLSSSSNSDSSDSTSDSSDSSLEYERYYNRHDDDDEHGHKKIVMIKKKPKQNLPNFIFLPNLETPFYPPMGLPPPAIPVPMYPMVPVPPMVPFIHIEDVETTAVPDKTTSVSTTTAPTTVTTEKVEQENNEQSTKIPEQAEEKEPIKLNHLNKKRRKDLKSPNNDKTGNDLRSLKIASPGRHKFLQNLKKKIQNQSAKLLMSPWMKNKKLIPNSFSKQNGNYEYPYIENTPDSYMTNDIKSNTREDGPAIPENVDFKYITELIHRDDLNNDSNKLPPIEYNPIDSVETYQSPLHKGKTAEYIRSPDAHFNRRSTRPHYQKSDESYYMNLGRQIASMIRSVDIQNKELNIKLETNKDNLKNDVFVNSPRSFWERSVRSPLTFMNSNKKNYEYLKRSNELLFNIENKVEIIASTTPSLSLREIENIVSVIETAKTNIPDNETILKDDTVPENNLNINLWPQSSSKTRNLITHSISANLQNHIKIPIPSPMVNSQNKKKTIRDSLHGFSMAITKKLSAQQYPQPGRTSKFNSLMMETKSKIKPVAYVNDRKPSHQNPQRTLPNPKYIKPTFSDHNLRESLWDQEMNPIFKHRKYFDSSHNYFVKFPYDGPKNEGQKSYFHHEISNFDHIE